MESKLVQYEKDMAYLKAYLIGRKFFTATRNLKLSEALTPGFRKDGITPAFHHQVIIAFNFMGLSKDNLSIADEEEIYSAIFAHDVAEDCNLSIGEMINDESFDLNTAQNSISLNKKVYTSNEAYYRKLSNDHILAIVKGCDRLHNIFSMKGAFTPEKIIVYCAETEEVVLPMLKNAANKFPQYAGTIQGIRLQLKQQLDIYKHFSNE